MIRRSGSISILALTAYLFCGFTQPNQCKSNSGGGGNGGLIAGVVIGGAVVATAIVVPVAISHSRHTLKGCAITGDNGLQVIEEDSTKRFTLAGTTDAIKVGDTVKLHGSRQKKQNGAEQAFVVEKISKDYGPCKVPDPLTPKGD